MTKSGPQRFPGALTDHFFQDLFGGDAMEVNTIVWHSTETTSLPGYQGGAVAPNFTAVPDFHRQRIVWHQHFDFDTSSRALLNPPGGVQTNRRNATQIEIVGTCDPKMHQRLLKADRAHLFTPELPDWVIRDFGAFSRWAHDNHRVPLRSDLVWKPFDASFGGHNGVRMSGPTWNAFSGHCGHQHVPENDHGDPGAMPIAKILAAAGTASAVTSVATTHPSSESVHVVAAHETLFGIAHSHGLSVDQLLAANPKLKSIDPHDLQIGTKIVIPPRPH